MNSTDDGRVNWRWKSEKSIEVEEEENEWSVFKQRIEVVDTFIIIKLKYLNSHFV